MNDMRQDSRLISIEKSLAAIFFILLVGSVFLQVLVRFIALLGDKYIFSLPWTEELARFSFAWLLMLGASVGMAGQQHYALTMVTNLFPKSLQVVVQIGVYIMELVFIGFLILYGSRLSHMAWGQISPALKIRYTFVYGSVPVGAFLMGLHVLQSFIAHIQRLLRQRSPESTSKIKVVC